MTPRGFTAATAVTTHLTSYAPPLVQLELHNAIAKARETRDAAALMQAIETAMDKGGRACSGVRKGVQDSAPWFLMCVRARGRSAILAPKESFRHCLEDVHMIGSGLTCIHTYVRTHAGLDDESAVYFEAGEMVMSLEGDPLFAESTFELMESSSKFASACAHVFVHACIGK